VKFGQSILKKEDKVGNRKKENKKKGKLYQKKRKKERKLIKG
jgi:hypothetical protein